MNNELCQRCELCKVLQFFDFYYKNWNANDWIPNDKCECETIFLEMENEKKNNLHKSCTPHNETVFIRDKEKHLQFGKFAVTHRQWMGLLNCCKTMSYDFIPNIHSDDDNGDKFIWLDDKYDGKTIILCLSLILFYIFVKWSWIIVFRSLYIHSLFIHFRTPIKICGGKVLVIQTNVLKLCLSWNFPFGSCKSLNYKCSSFYLFHCVFFFSVSSFFLFMLLLFGWREPKQCKKQCI